MSNHKNLAILTTLTSEIEVLFRQCKMLLSRKPVDGNSYVDIMLQIGDLRRELVALIGEERAYATVASIYSSVFPNRDNTLIIRDICFCFRKCKWILTYSHLYTPTQLTDTMNALSSLREELEANIGKKQAMLILATAYYWIFTRN
jgi:hypothetical protein